MMILDSPFNGYVDGHTDGEYLGLFVLPPGAMKSRNKAPENKDLLKLRMWNDYDDNDLFVDDYL